MAESRTTATTGPPIRALIVDNDAAHAETVADSLSRVGYECTVATTGAQGRLCSKRTRSRSWSPISRCRTSAGWKSWPRVKEVLPDAEVILVTGHGTIQSAVEAMQQGAFNYLLKPLDLKQLRAVVDNAAAQPASAAGECRAEPAAGRKIRLRGRHRQQPPDARGHRSAAADRSDRRHRADPGRHGHGQGTGRPGDPPEQPPQEPALRGV